MSQSQSIPDFDYTGNLTYWTDRWADNKIGWHRSAVNQQLIEFLPKLTDGNGNKNFFLPLCGKSLDIPYLHSQGHRVFGVEAVAKAIEDLNTEQSLGLKFHPESSTYTSDDGRITIYCGDIFTCPFEKFGPFDCVWDRGSFIAFEYSFRAAYKEMMQRSLRVKIDGSNDQYHNFNYLMETLDYDREKFPGPPRAVDSKDMELFFGDWTNIEVIRRVPELIGNVPSQPDIGPVHETHYFLTPKIKR